MKRIGVLFGMEKNYPEDIVENINSRGLKGISAEFVKIGAVKMDYSLNYDVIFDRVSHNVPYFRSILKLAVLKGCRVINNPFWSCADNSFFHAALASKLKFNIPRTVIMPSKEHPYGTSSDFMSNLQYPLNWEEVFEYVGFPAYIKPNVKNAAQNDYKVYNPQEFFVAYDLTGSNVMILQEFIDYESYFRCYVIGRKHVKIMHYDPGKPLHLRYPDKAVEISDDLMRDIEKFSIKLCTVLGFDFNTVEIAIRDGIPYILDFLNPSPLIDKSIMNNNSYEWLVETISEYLIEEAQKDKAASANYSWNGFLSGPKTSPKTIKNAGKKQ